MLICINTILSPVTIECDCFSSSYHENNMLPIISIANRGSLITETGFGSYDLCINPYVGCQFGCTYCYVRFFVKDDNNPWGQFVRLRNHINDKLSRELHKLVGRKLVIGTMTDPYQPAEKTHNLTRTVLQMIDASEHKPTEIGLFTRSPLVKRDIDLLVKLNVRIHLTITPFPAHILRKIEPISVRTESRFQLLDFLKKSGLKTHVSISPVLPIYSEEFTEYFAKKMAEIQPDGFTIDPMQVYGESFDATDAVLNDDVHWKDVTDIIRNKNRYKEWKSAYRLSWENAWRPFIDLPVLPIGMDHELKTRFDLRTGDRIDFKNFRYPQ